MFVRFHRETIIIGLCDNRSSLSIHKLKLCYILLFYNLSTSSMQYEYVCYCHVSFFACSLWILSLLQLCTNRGRYSTLLSFVCRVKVCIFLEEAIAGEKKQNVHAVTKLRVMSLTRRKKTTKHNSSLSVLSQRGIVMSVYLTRIVLSCPLSLFCVS